MIEITKLTMTKHCTQDRLDRLVEISMNVGWGNIVLEHYNESTGHIEALSDTGVLFVVSPNRKTLITAYLANENKAQAIALSEKYALPTWLFKKIIKNKAKWG